MKNLILKVVGAAMATVACLGVFAFYFLLTKCVAAEMHAGNPFILVPAIITACIMFVEVDLLAH